MSTSPANLFFLELPALGRPRIGDGEVDLGPTFFTWKF